MIAVPLQTRHVKPPQLMSKSIWHPMNSDLVAFRTKFALHPSLSVPTRNKTVADMEERNKIIIRFICMLQQKYVTV
jgi:hypothetical protein